MFNDIYQQYNLNSPAKNDDADFTRLTLAGQDTVDSCFAVSDFSQAAIAIASVEVQALIRQVWQEDVAVTVSRFLTNAWCQHSAHPIDWSMPPTWDEFAGDYRTSDGWIRLHTNAPHHRRAALQVLGKPENRNATSACVREWKADELELAVVQAGGAAAAMKNQAQWVESEAGLAIEQEPVVNWQILNSTQAPKYSLSTIKRPLSGLKVLDLTRVLAGPVCTRFLASLGADVLRIDPPQWNEDGNAIEMTIGKRCAGLDLRRQEDLDTFKQLLAQADVLVHGYRRDALAGLGLSDEHREVINPTLIDVALNAYGWSGPWRNRRGFDSLVQMSSGIAEAGQVAYSAEKPVPLPYQALDHVTGYLMAATVIKGIRHQLNTQQSYRARLSLARQAKLLQDLSRDKYESQTLHSKGNNPSVILEDYQKLVFTPGIEETPWGTLQRLSLPYRFSKVEAGFIRPASCLRSSSAQWSTV